MDAPEDDEEENYYEALVRDALFYGQCSILLYVGSVCPAYALSLLGYDEGSSFYLGIGFVTILFYIGLYGPNTNWRVRFWSHLTLFVFCYFAFILTFMICFEVKQELEWNWIVPHFATVVKHRTPRDSPLAAIYLWFFEFFIVFYILISFAMVIRILTMVFKIAVR